MNIIQQRKNLDTLFYSYQLPTAGNQYGLDLSFADDLEIDEDEMSVMIPFADGNRRDGVGDKLEVGGIRTERHRKNPIALFDHGKQVTLPIGMSEDPNTGEYTVYLDPNTQKAKGKVFFYQGRNKETIGRNNPTYDHAVFCEQLFDLIAKKFIRAGSIGYQIVKAMELPPDYETGAPKGMHLLAVTMLELSAVVLPANQDTVAKALSMPKICGKSLSPYLVKSLSPYLPVTNKKVIGGYDSKALFERDKADLKKAKKGDRLKRDISRIETIDPNELTEYDLQRLREGQRTPTGELIEEYEVIHEPMKDAAVGSRIGINRRIKDPETNEELPFGVEIAYPDTNRTDYYKSLRQKYRSKSLVKEFQQVRNRQKGFLAALEKHLLEKGVSRPLLNRGQIASNQAQNAGSEPENATSAGRIQILQPTPLSEHEIDNIPSNILKRRKASTLRDTQNKLSQMRE